METPQLHFMLIIFLIDALKYDVCLLKTRNQRRWHTADRLEQSYIQTYNFLSSKHQNKSTLKCYFKSRPTLNTCLQCSTVCVCVTLVKCRTMPSGNSVTAGTQCCGSASICQGIWGGSFLRVWWHPSRCRCRRRRRRAAALHCSNPVSHANQTHYGNDSAFLFQSSGCLHFHLTFLDEKRGDEKAKAGENAYSLQTSRKAAGLGCWPGVLIVEALKQTSRLLKPPQRTKKKQNFCCCFEKRFEGLKCASVRGDKKWKITLCVSRHYSSN